jgi:hypothetical protein
MTSIRRWRRRSRRKARTARAMRRVNLRISDRIADAAFNMRGHRPSSPTSSFRSVHKKPRFRGIRYSHQK